MSVNTFAPRIALIAVMLCSGNCVAQNDVKPIRQQPRVPAIRFVRPDAWTHHKVELTNSESTEAVVIAGGYFDGASLDRYERRVTLPPRSIRVVDIPARVTANEQGEINWHSTLFKLNGDSETPIRGSDTFMVSSDLLPQAGRLEAVLIADASSSGDDDTHHAAQMLIAAQNASNMSSRVKQLDAGEVPALQNGLDAVDRIMLAGSSIADSPARLNVLRNWVTQGGRLWIRLDKVDPRVVEQLLGAESQLHVIGQSSLTEFQLWNSRQGIPTGEPMKFDYPVKLVRVRTKGARVIHEADGWPASFVWEFGRGQVFVTTLGARAWIRERTPDDPPVAEESQSSHLARRGMLELLAAMSWKSSEIPLTRDDFHPYLSAQVGYSIPSRGVILIILSVFCCLVILIGMWLHARNIRTTAITGSRDSDGRAILRAEQLVVIAPILAVLFAIPIVIVGQVSRNRVAAGFHTVEVTQVDPQTSTSASHGVTAAYTPDGVMTTLEETNGLQLVAARQQLEGTLCRHITTDFATIEHNRVLLAPGIQFFDVEQSRVLSSPVDAIASFEPDGIHGVLNPGDFGYPQDSMIVGPTEQVCAVQLDNNGSFFCAAGNVLPQETYVAGTLLTDLQTQRQEFCRRLFREQEGTAYPAVLQLMTWLQPELADFESDPHVPHSHHSLVAIPLRFRRPATGAAVSIPSTFMSFEAVQYDDGSRTSVFDRDSRRWQESTTSTRARLRFDLPTAVGTLDWENVDLEMRISAPGRQVQILAGSVDALNQVADLDSPGGTYAWTMNEAEFQLPTHSNSCFVDILVSKTESGSGSLNSAWRLEYVRMDVYGTTTGPVQKTDAESGRQ